MSAVRYLSFGVDGVEYAVEAVSVREIVALPPITRVPDTPAHVRGVVNLRGGILPVVDLRVRLGIKALEALPADDPHTTMIVVEVNGAAVGLVVDAVTEMLDIGAHQIRSPAHAGHTAGDGPVRAVADLEDRSPRLLDAGHLIGRGVVGLKSGTNAPILSVEPAQQETTIPDPREP